MKKLEKLTGVCSLLLNLMPFLLYISLTKEQSGVWGTKKGLRETSPKSFFFNSILSNADLNIYTHLHPLFLFGSTAAATISVHLLCPCSLIYYIDLLCYRIMMDCAHLNGNKAVTSITIKRIMIH